MTRCIGRDPRTKALLGADDGGFPGVVRKWPDVGSAHLRTSFYAIAAESVGATPVSACFVEFRCGSWVGGSCSVRRRSASNRSPAGVILNPRQPALARSSTAHTSDRQECSPGSRPITLTRRRVSPKVRSMIISSLQARDAFDLGVYVVDSVFEAPTRSAWVVLST